MLSAFHVELIACLQGIQVATNLGIGNLILETDAINVQQAILSRSYDVRPEGVLIEEIKAMAMLNFSNFECKFLGRTGNRAAHVLVGLGYDCIEGEALISSSVPDDVVVIVADVSQVINRPKFKKKTIEKYNKNKSSFSSLR